MRINAHCHVFTFASFLTDAAEANLGARIKETHHRSDAVAHDALKLLHAAMAGHPAALQVLRLGIRKGLLGPGLLEFLRRGCHATIDAVTDDLFADMEACAGSDEETVVVPLMMDVVNGKSTKADLDKFDRQYEQTVLQAVRRPGRVLPFVAVNPLRPHGALEKMEKALESGECVGVKLYPSLGYAVNHPDMQEVMRICQQYDAPVTMHCNDAGFCGPEEYDCACCSPIAWGGMIGRYEVRFNFAHFGDHTPGKKASDTTPSWRDYIGILMDRYRDLVYADVSYQAGPLGGETSREGYAAWLHGQMNSPRGDNILFGSDSFMLLQDASEGSYWRFFENALGEEKFARIAETNPKRFLGLPGKGETPRPGSAMEKHIGFLRAKKKESGSRFGERSAPAAWLEGRL